MSAKIWLSLLVAGAVNCACDQAAQQQHWKNVQAHLEDGCIEQDESWLWFFHHKKCIPRPDVNPLERVLPGNSTKSVRPHIPECKKGEVLVGKDCVSAN